MEESMRKDIKKILISERELKRIVAQLGKKISEDYAGRNPLLVSVLKGSVIAMADIMRAVTIPCEIDFMVVKSYGAGTSSSGNVRIFKDLDNPIDGRDIIIIEDILDSGYTLSHLIKILELRNPKSVKICTLLEKPARHMVDITPDYVGKIVPDEFVVGYGLDYAEKYRNLPFVGILKESVYQNIVSEDESGIDESAIDEDAGEKEGKCVCCAAAEDNQDE